MDQLIQIIALFGGLLAFLFSLLELTVLKRTMQNNVLALLFFGLGLHQICNGFPAFFKFQMSPPVQKIVYSISAVSLVFFMSLNSLYIKSVLRDRKENKGDFVFQILPSLFFVLFYIAVWLFVPSESDRHNMGFTLHPLYAWSGAAAILCSFGYATANIVRCLRIRKRGNGLDWEQRTFLVMSISIFFILCLWSIGFIWYPPLILSTRVFTTLYILGIYIFNNRNVLFFRLGGELPKKRRTDRVSSLDGLNIPRVMNDLHELMEKKKYFRNPELTIRDVAGEIDISYTQLSLLLNHEIGESFSTFINKYRIGEAESVLLAKPEKSIIDISMDLGFSNHSVFTRVFKKYAGVAPKDFRKNREGPDGPSR